MDTKHGEWMKIGGDCSKGVPSGEIESEHL